MKSLQKNNEVVRISQKGQDIFSFTPYFDPYAVLKKQFDLEERKNPFLVRRVYNGQGVKTMRFYSLINNTINNDNSINWNYYGQNFNTSQLLANDTSQKFIQEYFLNILKV